MHWFLYRQMAPLLIYKLNWMWTNNMQLVEIRGLQIDLHWDPPTPSRAPSHVLLSKVWRWTEDCFQQPETVSVVFLSLENISFLNILNMGCKPARPSQRRNQDAVSKPERTPVSFNSSKWWQVFLETEVCLRTKVNKQWLLPVRGAGSVLWASEQGQCFPGLLNRTFPKKYLLKVKGHIFGSSPTENWKYVHMRVYIRTLYVHLRIHICDFTPS